MFIDFTFLCYFLLGIQVLLWLIFLVAGYFLLRMIFHRIELTFQPPSWYGNCALLRAETGPSKKGIFMHAIIVTILI